MSISHAASAASFIACACDQVLSAPQATWMIHQSRGVTVGNADELRGAAEMMDVEGQGHRRDLRGQGAPPSRRAETPTGMR
jgi:ATP-dependent Clp protease protease subunit